MNAAEMLFDRPSDLQATRTPESRGLGRDQVRLMITTPRGHAHSTFDQLPDLLPDGALLVVNRSATLSASLPAEGRVGGFVLNLSTCYGDGIWLAEPRWSVSEPGPLPVRTGDPFSIRDQTGSFVAVHPGIPRLWFVRFQGEAEDAMARWGAAIRYGYLEEPAPPLTAYQTIFSDRPGSAEMPSAARPFTARTLVDLHERGIEIVSLTLHAGVSSLEIEAGAVEDHPLYAEPFDVPAATAERVNQARSGGRRVVAVGTTVVRALESAWDGHRLRQAAGFTRRFIRPGNPPRAVDALLTGFHEPRASHLAMLFALAERDLVMDAYRTAAVNGYLWHEFGDSHLLLP